MRLKIIGTGSRGNCYALYQDNHIALLDAGVPYGMILKSVEYRPQNIDMVLITHTHQDHIKAVQSLQKNYIHVYHGMDAEMITDGRWLAKAFAVEHDVFTVGYLVEHKDDPDTRVCYITDTGYCRYSPSGITDLIIECNFVDDILLANQEQLEERYMRSYENHMSLKRVLSFLEKIDRSRLRNVILTHLSDTNSDEQRMIKEVKDFTGVCVYAAHEGDFINLTETDMPF